ncbi:WD40/YVTN/BNR-like repeat-containing protein [Haliea sp. E17]|uniref:WD40/YVTN/BNR-like repeat-containing protein n=1 Tax=Haliea sp. E17 TaxID=3401576 RepID=UPI003AAFB707
MPLRLLAALLTALALAPFGSASADTIDFAFQPAIRQAEPTRLPLMDITRAGSRIVVAGERGVIAYSDDEGATWTQAEVPVSTTLTAVDFADAQQGWATGHGGVILHSGDAGATWSLQFDGNQANQQFLAYTRQRVAELETAVDEAEDPELADELSIALEDAEFAVEDAEAATGTGPVDPFLDILMLDSRRGFAVGAYGMLYATLDGGEHWQLAVRGIDNPDRYHYYSLAVDAAGALYLAGEAGLLYHSSDNGATWQRSEDLYDGSLFGALAPDASALVFGLRGHVFRSEDRGASWQSIDTGVEYGLYGGAQLDDGRLLIVGAGGQLLLSDDGGRSFSASNHPSRTSFAGGLADGRGGLLLVGMDGLIRIEAESNPDD